MNTLYHRIPSSVEGDTLYPMNELREKLPEAYARASAKYKGKEALMEEIIPILDCKWNDVLHFSAVHPGAIKLAFAGFGHPFRSKGYYSFDASLLDPEKAVVYMYGHAKPEDKYAEGNIIKFDPSRTPEYADLSDRTMAYYKKEFAQGRTPLLHYGVPHILYKGSLKISDLKVVEV